MRKLTKNDLGEWFYPVDNSYSYNLKTGECEHLAGTSRNKAVKVKLVLSPFRMTINYPFFKNEIMDFVIVEDKSGNRHRILNLFYESEEEAALANLRRYNYLGWFDLDLGFRIFPFDYERQVFKVYKPEQ